MITNFVRRVFFDKPMNSLRKGDRSAGKRRTTGEKEKIDIANFRRLPPFEAFTKCAWVSIVVQAMVGIAGGFLSYYSGQGEIGGVMSGITGLWFVQLAWLMSLPSKCSQLPYHIALCILPLSKSIGFLCVAGPDGEVVNWPEFIKRMLILVSMWCFPMWLAGTTIAEVVRCRHGDLSRYKVRNTTESKTIFATRHSKGIPLDSEGISIRERTMASTVKYALILPIVVYITFYAIGAMTEAGEYDDYGPKATVEDTFKFNIGRQFYMDYIREAYSNIFQGLVTVFVLITDSAFSCSAMDIGEIMIFRFHRWEVIAIVVNSLFFVAGVYFGSAIFDPINSNQQLVSYWSIWVLPCLLMLSLYGLARTVLLDRNELTKKRIECGEQGRHEEDVTPRTFSELWSSFNVNKSTRNMSMISKLGTLDEDRSDEMDKLWDLMETQEHKLRENSISLRKLGQNGRTRARKIKLPIRRSGTHASYLPTHGLRIPDETVRKQQQRNDNKW